MKLPTLYAGILIKRYKRFLADVNTPDGVITAHCPNTGAMTGCAEPGSPVWYSLSDNPKRKYAATWEFVDTSEGLCSVNTGRANKLVAELLTSGALGGFSGTVKAEASIPGGGGRFDFQMGDAYIEVKSVTLSLSDGLGAFPDAVSERALKHVHALQRMLLQGHRAVLIFCVQHLGIDRVQPAAVIDPAYADALQTAIDAGIEVYAYGMSTDLRTAVLDRELTFLINEDRTAASP
jgi:sugar fermentation stimulation protein A